MIKSPSETAMDEFIGSFSEFVANNSYLGTARITKNTKRSMQDRRHRVAKHVIQFAEITMPRFLALEVVGIDARGTKAHKDALAVGSG